MSDQGCNFVGHWQILVGCCPMTDCYLQSCTVWVKCFAREHKWMQFLSQGLNLPVCSRFQCTNHEAIVPHTGFWRLTLIIHFVRWAVIVGTTVVLRSIVTVPLAVHQNKLIAKIELSQPTLHMMTEALKQRVTVECRRMNMSAEEADLEFRKKVGP